MKRLLALLLLLSIHHFTKAQNLVHNPDFSLHAACPSDQGQVNRVNSWYQVTQGTPDYFSSCSLVPQLQVPANTFGYQASPSNAMLGFYTFDAVSAYREYIGTDIPPLTIDLTYDVTIRVSLADSVRFATDGLGVYFYVNGKPDTNLSAWIPVTPQIDYSDQGILTDKVKWITLTKQFVADSNYTHLVIGSFKSDADTHLSAPTAYMSAYGDISYYYIDSVSVSRPGFSSAISSVPADAKAKLAPNPFRDFTVLTFDNRPGDQYTLSIYNAQGSVVYRQENIVTGHVRIDRNNLPDGFYYYQLRGADNVAANGKMLVE